MELVQGELVTSALEVGNRVSLGLPIFWDGVLLYPNQVARCELGAILGAIKNEKIRLAIPPSHGGE